MSNRHLFLSTVSLVALTAGLPAVAFAADPLTAPASLPAVSAPNGKVGAFIGTIGSDFTLGATGSFAVPLSGQWGAQLDGMFGTAGGASFYGAGGHLFWRDPSKGLLGAYASYVTWDATAPTAINGTQVGKVGVEGAAYLGRISIEGMVAYQYGTFTGFTGKGTLAWYPTDNLRLDVSAIDLQGLGVTGSVGGEWAPTASGMTIFGNAGVADGNNWHALGGLKVYFSGTQKSLIRRHREDDPDNLLPDDLYRSNHCPPGEHSDGAFCIGSIG